MTHQEFDLSAFTNRVHERPDLDLVREMVTFRGRQLSWRWIFLMGGGKPTSTCTHIRTHKLRREGQIWRFQDPEKHKAPALSPLEIGRGPCEY